MKVLHVVKTSVGAAWAYQQVRVLCSLGINVVVALPTVSEGLAPLYEKVGAKVVPANIGFKSHELWRVPAAVNAYRDLLNEIRPDVVHSHHVSSAFALRLAMRKHVPEIPHIFQVPGPLHLEYNPLAALDVSLARHHDYWLATCEWSRRRYLQLGVEPARVFLAYAGTSINSFGGPRTNRLRNFLGIPATSPLIGMVAYMYAPCWYLGQKRGIKGHEDFIQALALVHNIRHDVRAVIIGGAWGGASAYEQHVRALGARTCDGVLTFVGHRKDVPEIYPDLDLAVVPSHSENCGGAFEAMLSGVPVIATNVGGLPDLVKHRETGWLVPPRDPKALAHAILEVLRDTQAAGQRARKGQRLARDLFDVEKTSRQVAGIYERILAQSNPRTAEAVIASGAIAT